MAVAASRLGNVADTVEVRGSRQALILALLACSIGLVALPPLIGLLALAGLLT